MVVGLLTATLTQTEMGGVSVKNSLRVTVTKNLYGAVNVFIYTVASADDASGYSIAIG